ncbi:hypothetical protein B296_00007296 [Ensete ventricosum]|uniref:Uncharacterized protein n=1 Tax=Ensete ventricosum TaxID=4639 RepID=A0A427AQV0_ENSVE|nr:hypothetical protein B296_00007296 [Ensete ventricosum]
MCGLCQHLVRLPSSLIFGSLLWQFTFVHPLLGHNWTKHSSRTVRRLVAYEVPMTSQELVHHCLDPRPLSPTSIIPAYAPLVLDNSNDNTVAYSSRVPVFASSCPVPSRLRTYHFHVKEKVLMLHGTEFRSRLGMAMNTPSFVYKPLHEYRILRVNNSPHFCELCTTVSVITQHIPLLHDLIFHQAPRFALSTVKFGCQHRAIVRTQPSQSLCATHSSSLAYPHGASRAKGLAIPLNAKPECSLL